MKRWKKVLIWVISILVLLGIGGLFAANYVADRMIASIAASLDTGLIVEDTPGTEQPDKATGTDEPKSSQETEKEPVDKNNKPNEESKPSNTGEKDSGYKAEVSVEKAKQVQESVTLSEKAKLMSILLKQLSVEDIKLLQQLASGGLSKEDKKKARSLILQKLTPEQYDELIQIAKKYGLSEGKSYSEVIKQK